MTLEVSMNDDLGLSLKKNGIVDLAQTVSDSDCRSLTQFIDGFDESKSEMNYGGSEKRIWNAQKYCSLIEEFAEYSDDVVSRARGKASKSFTILAYSNNPCDLKVHSQGRWHVDSLRSQMKIFNFLRPVKDENGPLEILIKTHHMLFKTLGIGTGSYIGLNDLLGNNGSRKYSKLNEGYVNMLIQLGAKSRKMTTSLPGQSFLVDSSAIHRASPLIKGKRYALCAYYTH